MHSMRSNQIKGYLCAVVAAVLWGSSGIAGNALLETRMTPFELVQV